MTDLKHYGDKIGHTIEPGQRLSFGPFTADPKNYGHGAVVDVYFARKSMDSENEKKYVIRAAKPGFEQEFQEEVRVRELARQNGNQIIRSHMPHLVHVDMTHRPPYLVVSRIQSAKPLNEMVKEDFLNPNEKRSIAESLLEYVYHWHLAGIVLDDLGGEPEKGALFKCDRFLILVGKDAPKEGIGWFDLDANMTKSIAVQYAMFDRIEDQIYGDIDQKRSLFLWAKASHNTDFDAAFLQVTSAVADLPVWSAYEAKLKREAGQTAHENREFARKVLALPANPMLIDHEEATLRDTYRRQFEQAKKQKLQTVRASIQAARIRLAVLGIGDINISRVVNDGVKLPELDKGEAEKIQIFCQLLEQEKKGDEHLATFIAEHGLEIQKWNIADSIVRKHTTHLTDQVNQIERLADITTTGLVEGYHSIVTSGRERHADEGLMIIQHLKRIPDLVVKHKTGSITKRDYMSLAGIFSELLSNGQPREAQMIYSQFVAMIEHESETMDMSLDLRYYKGMKRLLGGY